MQDCLTGSGFTKSSAAQAGTGRGAEPVCGAGEGLAAKAPASLLASLQPGLCQRCQTGALGSLLMAQVPA